MKKFILISVIITSALMSCSSDDLSTQELNTSQKKPLKERNSNFCITCRDTIGKGSDSIHNLETDPIKPIKP